MWKLEKYSISDFILEVAPYHSCGFTEIVKSYLVDWQHELQQPPKISSKMKQWLANNEELPLMAKIEIVLHLRNQEILGVSINSKGKEAQA